MSTVRADGTIQASLVNAGMLPHPLGFNAGGFCDVVVDVVGTFYQYPPAAAAGAASSQVAPAGMAAVQPSKLTKRP